MKTLICTIVAALAVGSTLAPAADKTPVEESVVVFEAKKGNNYASIRIPSIINAGGTLIAAAEGRKAATDQGMNDIVICTSKDGKKWSKMVVAAASGEDTYNNPCLIYDKATKNIVLFFQKYPKGVKERGNVPKGCTDPKTIHNFVCFSKNGKSWSKPKDVTKDTKHDDVDITCSGPNPGCQLTRGPHKGRLIVPLNEGPFNNWTLAAAYSDDHGKTWHIGQKSATGGGVNEVSVAETEEGGLLIVSRHSSGGSNRKYAYSEDGGETWGPINTHSELPCPGCQNGLTRYSFSDDAKLGNKSRIIFTGPCASGRNNGVAKMSYDDGKTWPVEKALGPGGYAYSAVCTVKPGVVGVLFERDGKINFTTFTIDWLTDGKDDGKGGGSAKED